MDEKLNLYTPVSREFKSENYILHPGLKHAVEVAIALNQPLLLTGEPGTGKTKLAFKIAALLAAQDDRFFNQPFIFNTKTTSIARDLFYTYDALAHFQATNIRKLKNLESSNATNFIELQALGKAIAQTNPKQIADKLFKTELHDEGKSSVVLIDEIDKAPRDFSNDILNEIENYRFGIKELENKAIEKGKDHQIVVIMTSNSEKNLPDAFLRRCVFYHIPFPDKELLLKIVKAQIGDEHLDKYKYTEEALDEIMKKFGEIRKKSTRKKPATAELVAWIRMLGINGYMKEGAKAQKELMLQNLSILVKTQEDMEAVRELLKGNIEK